jgi:predicted RNA polymerase sigma factor
MTSAKVHRINARLSPDVARKVAYLQRRTKMSTTDVVRESIDRYYAAVMDAEGSPADLLERAGFVACAEGPEDLSVSYKASLAHSIGQKT